MWMSHLLLFRGEMCRFLSALNARRFHRRGRMLSRASWIGFEIILDQRSMFRYNDDLFLLFLGLLPPEQPFQPTAVWLRC